MTKFLFDCSEWKLLKEDAMPSVSTPLGILGFNAAIDAVDVCGLKPSGIYSKPPDSRLYHWLCDQFQAELLICRLSPSLPQGMQVDGCRASVWRVIAAGPVEKLEFRCDWKPGYVWTNHSPDSGEWLDAQTWDDGNIQVSVGTLDGPALASRASHGGYHLPHRWGKLLGEGWPAEKPDPITAKINPVVYNEGSFQVMLPELHRGGLCQSHFVVAWCLAPPTPEDARNVPMYTSPWYAVDQTPETILASAGCQ